MKREVIGCMGGGGNHLRWLLLLDPKFSYFRDLAPDNYSFIVNCVYPSDRNWQNWLNYEWRWRMLIEDVISFSHGRIARVQLDTRYCALQTDPDLALRNYLKFNSNLNTTLIQTFKKEVERYNTEIDNKWTHKNVLIVDGNVLYNSELDRDFYNRIIEWFELSDQYAQANEIHKLWWTLNQRAEREIITDLQKIYS